MTVAVRTDSARDPKGKGILCRLLVCALGITTAPCIAAEGTSHASGDWTMPAHDYASTRYSELADIDTSNVKDLTVQFTFSTGVNRGQEGGTTGRQRYYVHSRALS
ncbi:MAG: PQQ-dependent dehydrogenase, methanol/ethanol family [Gammaproteobacteria bacterium]|jgi:glucose dehydrogenase|nr:PQQ-dependent dehydrogenase, methanol/ethanol family [Gammaproteobacteria bacterium]